jgi:hypothetical protein
MKECFMGTTPEPEEDEVVTYLLPDGTEVSNDPRFHESKMRDQLLAQQREMLTQSVENSGRATVPSTPGSDTSTFTGRDIQNPEASAREAESTTYEKMSVADLKELAEQRQVDMTGVTKKSELVQRLKDDDESRG